MTYPLRSPRRALVTLALITLALLGACKHKAEDDGTENLNVDLKSTPPSSSTPAQPAPSQPAAQPDNDTTSDGYQIIHAKTKAGDTAIRVKAPDGWKILQPPSSPDPHAGKFSLSQALKGLSGKGVLVATITTGLGTFQCDLFDDKTPNTVANFVGLARGLRKFWDPNAREWVGRPFYDGTSFHRVIPGFMIQGGDPAGDGSGHLWYSIPDELHPSLKHDRGGQLCMANRGPNTNEAQFFITEDAAPHLDTSYTIFGQCLPTDLVYRIARVPQSGPPDNRPLTPVTIDHVTVARVVGGALSALQSHTTPSPASVPAPAPGVVPQGHAVQVPKPK